MRLLGITFVLRGVLAPFAHPIFTSMTGIGVAYAATHRHGRWAIPVSCGRHAPARDAERADRAGPRRARGRLPGPGRRVRLIAVIIADRRRIIRLIWRFSRLLSSTGLVTEADLRMLSTLRERRAARQWARSTGGRAAAAAIADYQLAATGLRWSTCARSGA